MPAGEPTYAEFYIHPRLNVMESRKEQRQIYEDEIWVEIKIKGSENSTFTRAKKPEDELKWPDAWAKFKGEEIENTGTSLRVLPSISPAAEKNLSALGVNTVEDLANLGDEHVIGFRGMIQFRKEAQAYLAAQDEDFMENLKASLAKEITPQNSPESVKAKIEEKKKILGALKKSTSVYKEMAAEIEELERQLE